MGEFDELPSGGESSGLIPKIIEEDLSPDFEVGNPEERSGHIEYTVKGKDR